MKKCWIVLLGLVFLTSCSSKTKIAQESDHLKISEGDFELAVSQVQDMESSYMVVSWMNLNGMDYLDACLCCMPINHVEFLHDRYGNFMRCDNRGADSAKQCTMDLDIILSDLSYVAVLDKIEKAKKNRMFPVIRVSGSKINIDNAMYRNGPFSIGRGSSTVVLVESIETKKVNYTF